MRFHGFIGVFSDRRGIIFGNGKSVFCLKQLMNVYKSWDLAKKYIVYRPVDLIKLLDEENKIPAILWDDAGLWSHRESFKKLMNMLNKIREKIDMFFMTSYRASLLPKKLLNEIDYYVYIYRPLIPTPTAEAHVYGRDGYEAYGKKDPLEVIRFDVYFEYYPEYEAMRGKYINEALKKLLKEMSRDGFS
jgi:hypothetical protein